MYVCPRGHKATIANTTRKQLGHLLFVTTYDALIYTGCNEKAHTSTAGYRTYNNKLLGEQLYIEFLGFAIIPHLKYLFF